MNHYLFFLSHVRGADEEWVGTFFRDLCNAVAIRTGRSPDSVGLRGNPDSREPSLELMGQAGTLVALWSPQYAARGYCAAEWDFFQQRRDVHWSRTGRSADAIVPVTWIPPLYRTEPPPDWPAPLQVASGAYEQDGVLHVLRLRTRYKEAYQEVVEALADRLVAAAQEDLPDLPGFAFVSGRHTTPAAASLPGRAGVDVVVASTGAGDLPEQRQSREFYGPSPLDWCPYHPGRLRSLVSLVKETAADLELPSTVLSLDDPAVDLMGTEDDAGRFVVLLVDAWAAGLQEQRRLLAELDSRPSGCTAVLEPRSVEDAESAQHSRTLDDALDHALPHLRSFSTDLLERWALPDSTHFTAALRKALVSAQNDAMKSTADGRDPDVPAGSFDTFPQLGRFSS